MGDFYSSSYGVDVFILLTNVKIILTKFKGALYK